MYAEVPPTLFHLTTVTAWTDAQQHGEYRAPSLDTEGFIHLSLERQWRLTAARFFRGQSNLVLLELNPHKLTAPVRFEAADGDSFPHLYGALNLDAVPTARPLSVSSDGTVHEPT